MLLSYACMCNPSEHEKDLSGSDQDCVSHSSSQIQKGTPQDDLFLPTLLGAAILNHTRERWRHLGEPSVTVVSLGATALESPQAECVISFPHPIS